MSLIKELKKRNVFRVAVFYLFSAWVILQVGALLFDIMELSIEWKKGLLLLLIVGFPVALITSWVFEVTPDGVKLESEISGAEAKQSRSAQRMNIATIVAVLLGICLLGVDRYFSQSSEIAEPSVAILAEGTAEQNTPIIAVLPFFASGSDDGGFLATGLHDDLLTRLARLSAFKVISRTSMMEYAHTTKNMREIGEELGARYILQGGVQAIGVRVRINAQLIDAKTDRHLWAESYDRELTALDLFDIQADLARAIASQLSLTLTRSDSARIDNIPTESITAYNAYLRALELRDRGGHNRETSRLVIEALEKSVEIDPSFADAWVQLSIEHSRLAQSTTEDREEYAKTALASRAKAFDLDPQLPEGIVADAIYQYRVLFEYQKALDLLTELELSYPLPARVVSVKSFLFKRLGYFGLSYQTLKVAYELDPRSVTAASLLVDAALAVGRCQEANEFLLQALSMAPKNANVLNAAAEYEMACTGNINQAAKYVERNDYNEPWHFLTALRVAEIQADFSRMLQLSTIAGKLNLSQTSNIIRADALIGLGRLAEAEAVKQEIKQALFTKTVNKAELSLGTQMYMTFSKLQFFRLERDQSGAIEMVKEHKRLLNVSTKGDKVLEKTMRLYYAEAFIEVGLKELAMAEFEAYFGSPGAYPFLYVDIYPLFASLKGHPGYEVLRERYATIN